VALPTLKTTPGEYLASTSRRITLPRVAKHHRKPRDVARFDIGGRFPTDGPLYGNEFTLRGSMSQRSGHIVCVARFMQGQWCVLMPES
jgi:hypothetical protein